MNQPVILLGGPADGRLTEADDEATAIEAIVPHLVTVNLPPFPASGSRPRWWRHPLAWRRWKPSPEMPELMPEFRTLIYRFRGDWQDGRKVFVAEGWEHFRGPEADADGDIFRACVDAAYAVHPVIRLDLHTHWVMDLAWWLMIWRANLPPREPDEPEPIPPAPSDADLLLGMPIQVRVFGGRPHLENPRLPHDYLEKL